MAENPHLLVVDDDAKLRALLVRYLTKNGFSVCESANPKEADDLISLIQFDLMIMDVMMPGKDGLTYTKELRKRGITTPILMLTAMGDSDNRIQGLENGADDYLSKPFEPKELLLRIHNILKRALPFYQKTEITFGPFKWDSAANRLFNNETLVPLTTTEQTLFQTLLKQAGQPISREKLAECLATDNIRTVDVQITRLRKKIETDIKHPLYIQTIRGEGYTLKL